MPLSGALVEAPHGSETPVGSTLAADRPDPISPPSRLPRLCLTHLACRGFRNLADLELPLGAPRLLVIGANGVGKSNLLEAVELLLSLRSHRCPLDRDLIHHGASGSRLMARTADGDQLELLLRRRGGRSALRNGTALERQLELPGRLRCVTFSALDLDLVRGEPALRRQWLDRVVLQLEPIYGTLLSQYGRLLRQRSQLLRRDLAVGQRPLLLDAFDEQMALLATRLHRRRRRALARLDPLAAAWQARLSGGREQLRLHYRAGSRLEGEESEDLWRASLLLQLQEQRAEEARLLQCQVGPHRDEVDLLLDEHPARRHGSAGQQRTLVLALKLAELELVGDVVGQPPLLLLDDVLAELDPGRQGLLLEAVGEGHQCLVSATHLDAFDGGWRQQAQVVRIHAGAVTSGDGTG